MQFHAAFVAFVNHPLQRVPIGLGSLSLPTGQVAAPGFQFTGIKGISGGSDLEDYGIAMDVLQGIEVLRQFCAHGLGRKPLELSVDTLYPTAAKLAFGVG